MVCTPWPFIYIPRRNGNRARKRLTLLIAVVAAVTDKKTLVICAQNMAELWRTKGIKVTFYAEIMDF